MGHYVKRSHRLNIISEKLYSVWVFFCKVEYIYDVASNGELTGAFYLIYLLIAHVYQLSGYILLINCFSFIKIKDITPYNFSRNLRAHKGSKGRNNRYRTAFYKSAHSPYTLTCKIIGMNICLIEYKILSRIDRYITVIEFIIFKYLFGSYVRICHDYAITNLTSKPVYHMELF